MKSGFEEIEHTADIALRVWGKDLRELFINAAAGLAWLLADPESVEAGVQVPIEIEGYDAETLLVTWLGELLYIYERDGTVFVDYELQQVTPTTLRGTARGGSAGVTRHHIKAVTFHQMNIRGTERGVETDVVFDV